MIPLILSGGSGTRLWPVSRESHPKQFCALFDESLILKTIRRLSPLGSPWVITTRSMQVLTERLYAEQGLPLSQIILEPFGRNTAAAIALACRQLLRAGQGSAIAGIFPADHFVENTELFHRALLSAETAANAGRVVTLGITPTWPATGYGYIELAENQPYEVCAALRFREKPEKAVAEAFLASGRFVWNAGIFVFRVDVMAALFERHLPGLWQGLEGWEEGDPAHIYGRLPSVSIDVGIMEKLTDLGCVPCAEVGWNDVGSWDEVANLSPGQPMKTVDVTDCFVFSTDSQKSYAMVGVEGLRVIDTPDALLVVKKGSSQAVKDVQAAFARAKEPVATMHRERMEAWGRIQDLRPTLPGLLLLMDGGTELVWTQPGSCLLIAGEGTASLDGTEVPLRLFASFQVGTGQRLRLQNRSATETLRILYLPSVPGLQSPTS